MPCHHNLETYLQDYIEAAGLAGDREGPLFRTSVPAHRRSDRSPDDAVRRLAHDSAPRAGRRHSDGGLQSHLPRHWHHRLSRQRRLLENAQAMAAHESPRTTKLYDRTDDQITLDEVEKIGI